MPQRQAVQTVTIRTPEAMGDDSWVTFRKSSQLAGKHNKVRQLLEEQGCTFDIAGRPYGGEFTPAEMETIAMIRLAESLVDWNWVDNDGNPLPKPTPDDPEASIQMLLGNLRHDEIDYLSEKLAEFLERPGNSRRSKHSSRR
ncbi:MAG: hypothetical protein JXB07_18875 [Anaerolineae bacterium]|nr:hypothetical protein [Anaerolineae bacterium]